MLWRRFPQVFSVHGVVDHSGRDGNSPAFLPFARRALPACYSPPRRSEVPDGSWTDSREWKDGSYMYSVNQAGKCTRSGLTQAVGSGQPQQWANARYSLPWTPPCDDPDDSSGLQLKGRRCRRPMKVLGRPLSDVQINAKWKEEKDNKSRDRDRPASCNGPSR